MSPKLLKLSGGPNAHLATIAVSLATLCGRYLAYQTPVKGLDKETVEMGREYFDLVQKGLTYTRELKGQTRGLSFDPDTLHSLNALNEVFLVVDNDKEVDNWINKIETIFNVLDGTQEEDFKDDDFKGAFTFFNNLSDAVKTTIYNPEVSHTL